MLIEQKVFGIGFHKTGTKSLGYALTTLGYTVSPQFGTQDEDIASTALPTALKIAERFDAFQDNPWPILFRELDQAFPGSKFILTTCPTDEWVERMLRYFGKQHTPMRRWIYGYGSPVGNEAVYRTRYDAHNLAVREHFEGRPQDLLDFPLTQVPGWEMLCQFLGKDIPICKPFPHLNKTG